MAGAIAGRFCNKWNHLINKFKYLNLSCTQHHSLVNQVRLVSLDSFYSVQSNQHHSLVNQVRFVSLDSFHSVQSKKDGVPPSSATLSQKPKFPPNVFLVFLSKMGPVIRKEHPEYSRKEVVSKASQMWKELDPEEKSKLALERKEIMEKYREDLKQFLQTLTPEQYIKLEEKKKANVERNRKWERKSLGYPKKPGGSFGVFATQKFAERADEKVTVFFKQLADRWSTMSDEEKEPYVKKAKENRAVYIEKMDKWEKDMMAMGRFDLVRKGSLRKLTQTKYKVKKNRKGTTTVTDEDVKK